jgi:hypothetical protein
MKISEVIRKEHSRTCQIQQEAVLQDASVQTQQPKINIAQNRASQVPQRRTYRSSVSPQPIPDQIKHKLIQDRLTKTMMRQSNIVKPTTDDIEIARNRLANELKRSDLEYQMKLKRALRKQARH